jgi:hypothetical protein
MLRRLRFRNFAATAAWFMAACSFVLPAQTNVPHPITSLPKPPSITSSAVSLPAMPPPVTTPDLGPAPLLASTNFAVTQPPQPPRFRPFSIFAAQVTASFSGVGIQVATPVAQRFNLRGGGSFITYATIFQTDGINEAAQINLRSANVSLDWYPFHNGFRISPGVTLYNGNNVSATLSVPGGQNFSLGDGTYTSSPSDPVHGTGSMTLGRRTVPSFTVGWGNMIPHNGRRLSIPIEIGFQYIGPPKVNFNLAGTACSNTGCANIATDPTSQADLQQQLATINNEIAPLRFYPIISIGLAWTFGSRTPQVH